MTMSKAEWMDDLTVQLRLAGMDGRQIGAIREEIDDHLQATGASPSEAFGPPADYASALAEAHQSPPARLTMTRSDLVAAAVQILAWLLAVFAGIALQADTGVEIQPGHLAGVVLLTAAMAWPVWPALQAYLARRINVALPLLAMGAAVAATVALHVWWTTPTLTTMPAVPTLIVAIALIAGCWARALRQRDPIQRPERGAPDAAA